MGVNTDSSVNHPEPAPARLTIALAWVSARRARDDVFGAPLFFNPAWDILLDLYIAHHQGRISYVSGVCVASSAPTTTVSRWIALLERQGLIERWPDPGDRRKILLDLSAEGFAKMEQALDASAESDRRLGLGRLRVIK